jgi:cation transport regulator
LSKVLSDGLPAADKGQGSAVPGGPLERSPATAFNPPSSREESPMPYDVNSDLPPSVRSHLPEHAQTIFREAFNHAYAAHARGPRQEEAAFRIARAAVKRVYEKVGDEWVERR